MIVCLYFTRWRCLYYLVFCLALLWLAENPLSRQIVFAQDRADRGEIFQAIADEVNREINEKKGIHSSAFQDALDAANFVRLESPDEIKPRMEIIKKLSIASEEVISVIRAAPAKAYLKARERGLSLKDAQALFEAMKSSLEGAKAGLIVLKMQADREWAELNIEVYDLLNRERDKWRPATAGGMIDVLGDNKFKMKLVELIDRIKKVEDRADALQDRIKGNRDRQNGNK